MTSLKVSKDVSLPLDIVTDTIAILAKRRAGKSYTMRRITEQLLNAKQQVVIVDPKGDQWGIRSSADGKEKGYSIIILGGEHGDLPLEVNAGEVVAKLVVEEQVSVLLDLSQFRKHEIATFMAIFLENLYRLKAQERYRTPVMLVVDEADAIAPQKPQKGEERMLGAIEDIVRRGGQRGIGCILVTQRSAVLNKNVLTQAQMLIVLRTIAPQDLSAMKAWIDVHGTPEQGKELMDSLPSLPIGDAWFWSPGGIFKRSHVLPITTFDSGATPKPGERQTIPKMAADVDLKALEKQMAATIEKAKAEDPKALRREVASLKKELEEKSKEKPVQNVVRTEIKKIEVPMIGKKTLERFKKGEASMRRILGAIKEANVRTATEIAIVEKHFEAFAAELRKAEQKQTAMAPTAMQRTPVPSPVPLPKPPVQKEQPMDGEFRPSSSQQKILDALAWFEAAGINPVNKTALAFIADARPTSGNYTNNLGALRTAGLIDYPSAGMAMLTNAGRNMAAIVDKATSSEELQQRIKDKVSASQRVILEALIRIYPEAISKVDLANTIQVQSTSGNYTNNLGALRTLGLIDYPAPGTVVALPILFLP